MLIAEAPSTEEIKLCLSSGCRRVLVKKERERPSEFKTREYCDISCMHAKRRDDAAERLQLDRRCAYRGCDELLVPREYEKHHPWQFNVRPFCNARCERREWSAQLQDKRDPGELERVKSRLCADPRCRRLLVQREDERWSEFKRRASCGMNCRPDKRSNYGDHNGHHCEIDGCGKPILRIKLEKHERWVLRRRCEEHRGDGNPRSRVGEHNGEYCDVTGCGKPVLKLSGEKHRVWQRRRRCEEHRARRSNEQTDPSRYCANRDCGKLLTRKPSEALTKFRFRKTCDVRCGIIARSTSNSNNFEEGARFKKKYCPLCRVQLVRKRREGGTLETPRDFLRRTYCSDEHMRQHKRQERERFAAGRPPGECAVCHGPLPDTKRSREGTQRYCSPKCRVRGVTRNQQRVGPQANTPGASNPHWGNFGAAVDGGFVRAYFKKRATPPSPGTKFETVEEFLARGGRVERLEPRYQPSPAAPLPVFSKTRGSYHPRAD
jgi:hypothetical protein